MTPLRVLIVEDSEDDALLLVHELRRSGRDVVWERVEAAEQMKAALERESWDLVVSDYVMPHFSAPKALELLKETSLDLPFIVVSGKVGEDVAVEMMKAGAHDFLLKGSLTRLVPAVNRELEHAGQRRARREAEEAHARLAAIVESSGDAIIGRTLDGVVRTWNPGAERLYGYSAGEVLGRTMSLHVPAERAGEIRNYVERIRRGEVVDSFETVRIRKDGARVDVSLTVSPIRSRSGETIGASTIARDITLRKRAEEALERAQEGVRASEQRVRALMENATDAIYVSTPDGTVLEVNRAAEKLQGRSRAEIVGRPMSETVAPEERDRLIKSFQETLSKSSVLGIETLALRADGQTIPIEVSATVVHVGHTQVVHAIVRDVSARRQLEDQLRQAQKMEAVGRLAGGIAHDFNNLLTAILGYAQLAAGRLQAEDPMRIELAEIEKAGQRAADLTRQLLAFSRKQVLQPRVISLNEVVSDTDKMLRRLIGEDIELVTLLKKPLGSTRADTGQIEQVLLNLAVNSRDAMPKGGKLTIETSEVELDGSYSAFHLDVPPGPYVLLAVSDTGTGMDAKTLSHVFEPFFTTKAAGEGTGLGLSTVYGIVKQSGGHVTVYSEPGVGTTFKIYLPRVEGRPEKASGSFKRRREIRGTETVLVVEDEEGVRRLVCRSLEAQGYKVVPAANAGEALLASENHPEEIQLMLTDVVMPHLSGRDLAKRIAAQRPRMRVLFMSGYTDNAIVHHGVLDAGTPFLQKPFTPHALALKVREVLDSSERRLAS